MTFGITMSNTIKNLISAFLGECQARNRYTFYASAAKKEGYEQIAEIMTTTAEQEKKHGKTFYEFLVKLNKESATPTKIELPMDLGIEIVL
jgi:rubrerythrin